MRSGLPARTVRQAGRDPHIDLQAASLWRDCVRSRHEANMVTLRRQCRCAEISNSKRINCLRLPGEREPHRGTPGAKFKSKRKGEQHEHTTSVWQVRDRTADGTSRQAAYAADEYEDEEDGLEGAPSPLQCAEEHPEAGAKAQIDAASPDPQHASGRSGSRCAVVRRRPGKQSPIKDAGDSRTL